MHIYINLHGEDMYVHGHVTKVGLALYIQTNIQNRLYNLLDHGGVLGWGKYISRIEAIVTNIQSVVICKCQRFMKWE